MQDTKKLSEMKMGEYIAYLKENPNFFMGEVFLDAVRQNMEREVEEKAGKRYQRGRQYSRWGYNPGSIVANGERCRLDVPRILEKSSKQITEPEIYKAINKTISIPERMVGAIINGLSQKNYKQVARLVAKSFGLSQGAVSRKFQRHAKAALEELLTRDLGGYEFVALMIDGKYFSGVQVIHVVGITDRGHKIALALVESTTENSQAISGLLKGLINRNLRFESGILVVSDGSKGIRKAIDEVFGDKAIQQRCQWHKRENVLSYLPEEKKKHVRFRINQAYNNPGYESARAELLSLANDLGNINDSAKRSLLEGLEETLTIHKLGVREELGKSLCTTNVIENFNSQLEKRLRNVKRWRPGKMRSYWSALTLLEIEKKSKRVHNAEKLYLLKHALAKITNNKQVLIA